MNGKEKKRNKRKIDGEEQKQKDRKIETNRIRGGGKKLKKGKEITLSKARRKQK